ncbi:MULTISPECIES: methyltransferase domain-containing protein [Actinoalloteichus]|uniref:Protein-L-isoaspartate O-methyltransferase n=1 Tax=Actinoalloteichus fjordicus TaxID=1612552 RepID=A0AAC9LEB3_9PSEU|nr:MULTISPECIES: methyltransferase domain-containing protein [Actinoalloteichus]APU14740.1 Protein-L-isoaspartate(D-aspartate) O-methyltransferase (PCMT) [Actinoalloteichus fjordicus]APU20709.1 Protein-L-isoaspartate(D-aspartate) O-methyltransferase (PCMT) [Actinoalloteichus sp. GBA129-24]
MTADPSAPAWRALFEEVRRAVFIPDTIWVDVSNEPGYRAVSRHRDRTAWETAVAANRPVVTQINLGEPHRAGGENFPTSSSSQPSIVADMLAALDPQPGDSVLEIGTGTGWNAALLKHRVGPAGHVTTIEVDPGLAEAARAALDASGFTARVVTGDGEAGCPVAAPFDRVISTASVREVVPRAWLEQLRPGGRLVTPWSTDYATGALLAIDLGANGVAGGRFATRLSFMRLRAHRRGLFGWEPDEATIARAAVRITECRNIDLDRMLDPARGNLAIGVRLHDVSLALGRDRHGPGHHVVELDDATTRSFARLDWPTAAAEPFTVGQFGPRRLWDEAEDAYDWWYERGQPGPERLGLTIDLASGRQIAWLDDPDTIVRTWWLPRS